MQKPNKNRTCEAETYCRINRTPLVQVGDGLKLKCPICDTIYDPEYKSGPTAEEKREQYRDMMQRKYGWPTSA